LTALRTKMQEIGPKYFPEQMIRNEEQFNALMTKINALADQDIGRRALVRKLIELGANKDETYTEGLADTILYSYFTQMKWMEGDTFNLAIGQGDNAYTPLQMARYVAAVANNGNLNTLTLVKTVDGIQPQRKPAVNVDPKGYTKYLRQGMLQVTTGNEGTARQAFVGFPIKVGAKTGTAQKEGKLPTENEEDYLKQYLRWIAPNISLSRVQEQADVILEKRNNEVAVMQMKLSGQTMFQVRVDALASEISSKIPLLEANKPATDSLSATDNTGAIDDATKAKLTSKINDYFNTGYLTYGSAMREAIKVLSDRSIKDDDIDRYKENYDNFTWFVSFAPYDDPKIAVVVFIPQGGAGGFAGPIVKDVCAKYFNLTPANPKGSPVKGTASENVH